MTETRFLTSEQTTGLASLEEYIDIVRDGFRQHGDGAPTVPKENLWHGSPEGRLAYYGAVLPESGSGALVHTSGFESDDTWFVTPLFDAKTGEPLALIDGAAMNPLKTGAAGGVEVDVLARADASTVGVIGSGTQARTQLRATALVRDLDAVQVFSPSRDHREAFATEMDAVLEASVTAASSSRAAVSGVDIVITATTATTPVVDSDDLDPGTHVTAMGQTHPERRELDAETIRRAMYVPDLRERAFEDAGAFLYALEHDFVEADHPHADLGGVVAGRAPGRRTDDELTVFDSGGTAIETVAAASLVYERAVERDVGSTVDFAPASEVQPGYGGT